jgi:predicted regulator of Ras-like GTPase activity (Roadblock/LC7/MglB family)
MSELKKILENFCKLEGVKGAIIIDPGGKVVQDFLETAVDTGSLATLVSSSINVGSRIAQELNKAPLNQSYMEYEDLCITAEILEGGAMLVILAEAGANLGRIRLEIRKNRKAVEGLVEW